MRGTCEVCGDERALERCPGCERSMCRKHRSSLVDLDGRPAHVCKPCGLDRAYDAALIHGAHSISDALIEAVEANRYLDHIEGLDPRGFVT